MEATGRRWAAHLLRRAGFGGTAEEVAAYAALGYEGAVERLLHPGSVDDRAAEAALQALARSLDPEGRPVDAQALWLARMLLTRRPLPEKMALFWHNHFATSIVKVRSPLLMAQQAQLFRAAGLGNYQDLLLAVAKDPAMILWLDQATSVKGRPNENWARELLELFTIGLGHYSERDVQEVARAFTGWGINRRTRRFEYHPRQHDDGAKTIFGRTGNWNGADVIVILAPRIETGKLLARKLWRWFINDMPDEAGVSRLAGIYLDSGLNLTAVLRALLLSAEFRAGAAYYSTVKNPVEFTVGLLKTLGLGAALATGPAAARTWRGLALACGQMGMALYNPPSVGGWPGGATWMNPTTYFARANLAELILLAGANGRPAVNVAALLAGARTPPAVVDTLLDAFVGPAAPPAVRQVLLDYLGSRVDDTRLRGLVRLIASSPSYQMN
jgi:uncharacterized protein (DUF1800 family)